MNSLFDPDSAAGEDRERGQCLIQTSESTFRRLCATEADFLGLGYQQLWLYAMRHYPLMPPDPRSKDDLRHGPSCPQTRVQVSEIDGLLGHSPDHLIARSALLQARKPGQYRYDDRQFDFLAQRIATCFAEVVPDQLDLSQGLLADNTTEAHARSGIPRTRTHTQDAPFLFFDRLYADVEAREWREDHRCCLWRGAVHQPLTSPSNKRFPPDRASYEIVISQHDSHQPIHSDDGIEPMDLDPPSPESDYVILGRLDQSSLDDPLLKNQNAE